MEFLASQPGEKKTDGPDGDDQIDDKSTYDHFLLIHMMMKQLIEHLGALPYMMAIDAIYPSGDVDHPLPQESQVQALNRIAIISLRYKLDK